MYQVKEHIPFETQVKNPKVIDPDEEPNLLSLRSHPISILFYFYSMIYEGKNTFLYGTDYFLKIKGSVGVYPQKNLGSKLI